MENLAFVFQELLTVGERLRSYRQQVSDPYSFRAQLWTGIKQAEEEGRRRGYSGDDVELAIFAVVAFLDESILNLRSPIFADWPRQPMQEERYGHHIAGEIFFQNLQKLLARTDSHELADLLEVYHLCLLLGFAGRYSMGGRGDLRAMIMQTADKIQRIRQTGPELAPWWRLPNEAAPRAGGDPWVLRLAITAGACFALMVILFVVFYIGLGSGVDDLRRAKGAARPSLLYEARIAPHSVLRASMEGLARVA
jgi:type VI secretion system protein ImpK